MSEEAFRLKVTFEEDGYIHVHGNRTGLRDLADTCKALSELSDADARTAANHVIYEAVMYSADEGSTPMMVCLTLDEFAEPVPPESN
jgi:hypothetical protein